MKAVILAGGGGTRLWPLSVPHRPKQLQPLVTQRTMLEETIDRLDFLAPEDIFLAINEMHYDLIKSLCPQIPEENILIEPALRDTASCIGYAAAVLQQRFPGEVMAIIYADHLIQKKDEFQEKLKITAEIAKNEHTLNIIEVTAKTPDTNYGYVKLGSLKEQVGSCEVYELDSFKEKPDLETAEQFIKEGNYLWNTGIYVWKTDILLKKYQEHQPVTYSKLIEMSQNPDTVKELYPTLEKISIDYAIMERVPAKDVRIIKADLGWSDIGNWEAIWDEIAKEPHENITRGDVHILDTTGSLIYGDTGKKVMVIGLEDVVVIDTPDGLLVAKKDQSHRLKEIK